MMDRERSNLGYLRTLLAALSLCIIPTASIIYAQDGGPVIIGQRERLKLFGLESFQAEIEAYWRSLNNESTDALGVKTKTTESLFRETLHFGGVGYFGDPNLVNLDLNVSLQLAQEDIDSDAIGESNRTSETINEYDVTAVILQRSDSPLTIYSRRSQVLLSRQFADSLDSISIEHGARLSLRSDFMSNQFQLYRREQRQTGRFSGTDSEIIQDTFAWQGRIRPAGNHRLWWDYTFSNVDETGQILTPNNFTRHDAFVNHTYDFGSDSQHNIRSSLRLFKESGSFPVDRIRLDESLRMQHTDSFETKYVYIYDQQSRRNNNQSLHRGAASFRHELFDSLTTTGQLGSSLLSIDEGGFDSTQYFGDLGAKYQKLMPKGIFYATANINFNHQDDSERGSSIFITDEPHTFGTSGFIQLSRRNIVPGSIVITDLTGLITYTLTTDYTIRIFGDSIEVSRVLAGNIAPGQSVLVTYEIGPEPESTTDTIGYGITLRYRFTEGPLRGLSSYIRYRDQSQDRSNVGFSTFTGNDFNDLVFGLDYDIGRFSLTAEHQIHDSTLSPFNSTRFEGRYINRINSRSSFSANAFYQITDRTNEDIETAITNLTGRWTYRTSKKLRSSIVGTWRHEDDSTGTNSDAFDLSIDLNWRHRQTFIYCSLKNSIINSDTRDSTFQTFTFGASRKF